MNCYADYTQIQTLARLRASNANGDEFIAEEPVIIPVVLTEVETLLSEYDPSNPDSLSEETARHIAQTVLDALTRFKS